MPNNGQGKYYVFALRAAADMTVTVVVPAIVGVVGGRMLDARFDTGRTFQIALLIVAVLLTVYAVVTKARRYGEAFKKLVGESGNGTVGR